MISIALADSISASGCPGNICSYGGQETQRAARGPTTPLGGQVAEVDRTRTWSFAQLGKRVDPGHHPAAARPASARAPSRDCPDEALWSLRATLAAYRLP